MANFITRVIVLIEGFGKREVKQRENVLLIWTEREKKQTKKFLQQTLEIEQLTGKLRIDLEERR